MYSKSGGSNKNLYVYDGYVESSKQKQEKIEEDTESDEEESKAEMLNFLKNSNLEEGYDDEIVVSSENNGKDSVEKMIQVCSLAQAKLALSSIYKQRPELKKEIFLELKQAAKVSKTSGYDDEDENTLKKVENNDNQNNNNNNSSTVSFHRRFQMNKKQDKDWNQMFQSLLDAEDNEEKYRNLYRLANDFVQTATTIGKIIISELCVPIEKKMIKPLGINSMNSNDWKGNVGIAGGQKFFVENIFFKFFLDAQVREDFFMFGGKEANDEAAMKVANHELKGLMQYSSCNIRQLRFPFVAIISYKGFKLEAVSKIPINVATIKYGSSDSARTIHADLKELNELMEVAAGHLNLRRHLVVSFFFFVSILQLGNRPFLDLLHHCPSKKNRENPLIAPIYIQPVILKCIWAKITNII